jgi:NAD(P)-dependent dehydrogenase (short-subunit alcohol dehydrogenase family)
MQSLPKNYSAIVVGSNGGIGSALVSELQADVNCGSVIGLARSNNHEIDLIDETSIVRAAQLLGKGDEDFHLVINATGVLTIEGVGPEKNLTALDPDTMATAFAINATGPVLVLKHFQELLPKHGKCIFATISARVGSIGDNRLGGWYSYRASKAALNQLIKTASIELARNRPEAVCVALHPGTVESSLSAPFARSRFSHSPRDAAGKMLNVLDQAGPESTGSFLAFDGTEVDW